MLQKLFFFQKDAETNQDTPPSEDVSTEVQSTVSEEKKQAPESFNQKQVDRIVSKRVKEVKDQFGDYEELKNTVQSLTEQINQLQSQLQKESETKHTLLVTKAIEDTAKTLNLDPELAKDLIDVSKIEYQEEKPVNLETLLKSKIERFPHLVKRPVPNNDVVQSTSKQQEKTFKLNDWNNTNFFQGSGLRFTEKE